MKNRWIVVVALIAVLCLGVLGTWYYFMFLPQSRLQKINSFESCVKEYPIITLQFPPRCTTPDGRVFVSEVTPTKIGMPNPASVNCTTKGGTLNIVENPDGQVGMCTLPGGKICEEWAFFRGECK